jgi:DNA-binding GntR family transcriptional regulator
MWHTHMSKSVTIGKATAHQLACAYLREEIRAGRFPAGMRLKSDKIAETLGISRMPVRDALQQLQSEGLVVLRPNRGAVVTLLTAEDVLELFEIRALLEGLAVRHACEHLTQELISELETTLGEMNAASKNVARWLELHDQFHETLAAPCGRPRLMTQMRHARRVVLPYARMYVQVYPNPEVPNAEHEMLITIARRRNPDLLEAAMRDHVMSAGREITAFLREHPTEASEKVKRIPDKNSANDWPASTDNVEV